jgi:hypothetical protein
MLYRAKYTTLAEIKIPANAQSGKNFQFNTQQQLQTVLGDQRVIVEAMETYPNTAMAKSPLTNTNVVAAAADIMNATLTLQFGTFQGISQFPLASLCRIIPNPNSYSPAVFDLTMFREMFKIDWTKSYVTLTDTAPTATAFSYVFNVYYDYLPTL